MWSTSSARRPQLIVPPMRVCWALVALLALALSGCASTESQKEAAAQTQVPWGRPASWEHQGPGFGGVGF